MKKEMFGLLLALFMTNILLCSVRVCAMAEIAVESRVSAGRVDIRLREYESVEGKEIPYEDKEAVLPGQVISKIPRIYNDGEECYVRVKLSLSGLDVPLENILFGMEDWKKCKDGYYYYPRILKPQEQVDVFEGLKIPEDLPQDSMEEKEFALRVDAEAIQTQEFKPDYESEHPWGSGTVGKSAKTGDNLRISDIDAYKAVLGLSAAGILLARILLAGRKRVRDEEEENENGSKYLK